MIIVDGITKAYGPRKGVFDLSFTVKEGEVFGFLGPNGAGKTTTIRQLIGFITPEKGSAKIMGLDVFEDSHLIQKVLGYIPGEISFFDHMKGIDFLKFMAALRGLTDFEKMEYLISYLELDTKGYIKKMSKGMKQKLAIVVAFMHDPKILILDEPTSGLDPLMQNKFIQLIKNEQSQGKTILMSSHNFEEIERTCDRALIIKHGKQVALNHIQELKKNQRLIYNVWLKSKEDVIRLTENKLDVINKNGLNIEIAVKDDINELIKHLSNCNVVSLKIKAQSLEDVFMNYYKEDGNSYE